MCDQTVIDKLKRGKDKLHLGDFVEIHGNLYLVGRGSDNNIIFATLVTSNKSKRDQGPDRPEPKCARAPVGPGAHFCLGMRCRAERSSGADQGSWVRPPPP